MKSSAARWKCYRYSDYYRVLAQVYSPLNNTWHKAEFLVDTGFRGDIFLEKRFYEDLGLQIVELPLRTVPVARTLAGSVQLRAAITKVRIAGFTLKVKAYTPLYGYGKNLVGREVLNRLTMLLVKREKTCIRLPES